MIQKLIALILLLAASSNSVGNHFSISESFLSRKTNHPTVNKVHRDASGKLWIATQDGLLSYNGTSIERYDSHQEIAFWLPDSNITHFSEDKQGRIYILTFSGKIFRQEVPGGPFSELNVTWDVGSSKLRTIEIDSSNNLLIGYERGLLSYDIKFDSFYSVIQSDISVGLIAKTGVKGEDILLCTSKGLISLEEQVGYGQVPSNVLLPSKCTSIATNPGAAIYLATESGEIIKTDMEGNLLASIEIETHTRSLYVSDILLTNERLLVGSDSGLFSIDLELTHFRDISRKGDGLSSRLVQDLYSDNGHYWIATLGGLDLLTTPIFETLILEEKLSSDITSITEDGEKNIWIGSYDGLWRADPKTQKAKKFGTDSLGQRPFEKRITTLSHSNNELWIGFANGGVQVLDVKKNVLSEIRVPVDNDDAITSLLLGPETGSAWISTGREGLWRYDNGSLRNYKLDNQVISTRITNLSKTRAGTLLVFAESKLYRYVRSTDTFEEVAINFGPELEDPVLYTFRESERGVWWIGTKDYGLFKSMEVHESDWDLNFSPAGNESDHYNGSTYCIEIDNLGNLWVASDSGLKKLAESGNFIAKYDEMDGLQGDQFNLGASTRLSNGEIVMGGLKGYNIFDPHEIEDDRSIFKVKITEIDTPTGGRFDFTYRKKAATVAANHRQVEIGFTSLNFKDPTKNQYRYKLENFDEDWINSGSRNKATYTNLPSGEYTFTVQAANSSGIWNPEGASIDLVVLPPPWLTGWAYCLYFLLASVVLWGIHRIYYSFVIDRKANELAFEMHLAEERADDDMQGQIELQQDLVQSAYEHNKTTLALIADFLPAPVDPNPQENGMRDAAGHQARLAALSHLEECLYFQAGGSVVDLYKLTEMIFELVLPQATVDPSTIITINGVAKQLIPASVASPASLIICELVENAILHGFAPQSPANYIQVSFSRSARGDEAGDHWLLEISDNGVGVDLEKHLKEQSTDSLPGNPEDPYNEKVGRGLKIVRQLANQLNASISTKEAGGSMISIKIPAPPTF